MMQNIPAVTEAVQLSEPRFVDDSSLENVPSVPMNDLADDVTAY